MKGCLSLAIVGLSLIAGLWFAPAGARAAGWPIIREGARGQQVVILQYLLRQHGYGVAVDGAFGPHTADAVRAFQDARRLRRDGEVGLQTWEALIVTVQSGSRGDAVRAVQGIVNLRCVRLLAGA